LIMKKLLRLSLLLLGLVVAGSLRAQRDIGTVEVLAENKTLPVRVSANTPELNQLALQAFGTHGRYRLVASGFAFDIKFSAVTPTQVRVDIDPVGSKERAPATTSAAVPSASMWVDAPERPAGGAESAEPGGAAQASP
jgi:hypothetical protein